MEMVLPRCLGKHRLSLLHSPLFSRWHDSFKRSVHLLYLFLLTAAYLSPFKTLITETFILTRSVWVDGCVQGSVIQLTQSVQCLNL